MSITALHSLIITIIIIYFFSTFIYAMIVSGRPPIRFCVVLNFMLTS